MARPIWTSARIGSEKFHLLDLDHPMIEREILAEIDAGVDVYYDRRWELTEEFCRLLFERPELVRDRSVLILGSGIGAETLVIGRLAKRIYLNDLAPVALDLCARQLRKNNIHDFELLQGRYETMDFPPVDMALGCYLVYNPETAGAMKKFLKNRPCPVLLVNEAPPAFRTFLKTIPCKTRSLLPEDRFPCILFE